MAAYRRVVVVACSACSQKFVLKSLQKAGTTRQNPDVALLWLVCGVCDRLWSLHYTVTVRDLASVSLAVKAQCHIVLMTRSLLLIQFSSLSEICDYYVCGSLGSK